MNRRLLRALQRGGVAAETGVDTWGVWRSRDRRGRIIGSFTGAEVEILRLRNSLKPLGGDDVTVLIWRETETTEPNIEAVAPDFGVSSKITPRSLLEALISDCVSKDLRTRIRKACQNFSADLECANRAGNAVTMNWDALGANHHVKGALGFDPMHKSSSAAAATSRLKAVEAALTHEDMRFLFKMVLSEATRSSMAKLFALRPALAERKGFAILRTLTGVYDACGMAG